jgi:hypothetical protein
MPSLKYLKRIQKNEQLKRQKTLKDLQILCKDYKTKLTTEQKIERLKKKEQQWIKRKKKGEKLFLNKNTMKNKPK